MKLLHSCSKNDLIMASDHNKDSTPYYEANAHVCPSHHLDNINRVMVTSGHKHIYFKI